MADRSTNSPGYTSATFENLCGAEAAAVAFGGENDDQCVMFIGLTPCCGATGKGSADASTGVVCRACYREVSAKYGSHGWESIREAVRDAKCTAGDACADFIMAELDQRSTPAGL